MTPEGTKQWSHSLARAAASGLRASPLLRESSTAELTEYTAQFRDGMGQLREVDAFLLAHLAGLPMPPLPASPSADLLAWAALESPSLWAPTTTDGPFAPELRETSIEVWTECELAALHARAWADLREGGLSERTLSAARWLVDEMQPDNATGRPWGIHVFAWMARHSDTARMYAETLLHNTLVAGAGRPEPLSACIVLDASRWLVACEPAE